MRAAFVILAVVVGTSFAAPSAPKGEVWKLVWEDDFKGKEIDGKKWTQEVDARGGGNKELQYYTARPKNSRIEDGALVIEAHKETYTDKEGTRQFTSARLNTRGKASWKYCAVEFRAKMPRGKGLWPAVWMMPEKDEYGGWAASGEIDIMEYLGHEPHKVHGTLHYGGSWPKNVHSGKDFVLEGGDFSKDFHVFRIEWLEKEFRWYVDGKLFLTQTKWHSEGHPYPAPFDKPFHLIVNLAVGGNWPGNPDESTVFPQVLTIDSIRVYQLEG